MEALFTFYIAHYGTIVTACCWFIHTQVPALFRLWGNMGGYVGLKQYLKTGKITS